MKKKKLTIKSQGLGGTLLVMLACTSNVAMGQEAGLVNYWDFESPDPFLDKKGTAVSAVTASTTVTTVAGVRGAQAMNALNSTGGDDDFLDVDGTTLHQPGTEAFSFSYWFRIPDDGLSAPRGIFDFSANGGDGVQSLFIDNSTNPNGQPSLAFRIDHDNGGVSLTFIPLTEGNDWHFLAATYDAVNGLQVHLDGFGLDGNINQVAASGSPVSMAADSFIGSFNFAGTRADKGLGGDVDDFAIYSGVLSQAEIEGLFDGTMSPLDIEAAPKPKLPIGHYWDFDTDNGSDTIPDDLYGGLLTTAPNGVPLIDEDPIYGPAYAGAAASLNGDFASDLYLEANSLTGAATGLDFGKNNFAISYRVYDHFDVGTGGDEDARGPMVMDCLNATATGFQITSDTSGIFNFRLDDDEGNEVLSNAQPGFENLMLPRDQWVCVVLNVDRGNNEVEVFFDGVSQGKYSIAALSGNIVGSQNLQLGVINGGGFAATSQRIGLDDVAIYPGILSSQSVMDLCAATSSPVDILQSFEDPGVVKIVSCGRDASGEFTLQFASKTGKTYSIYGGEVLADSALWPELSTMDLVGDGSTLGFSHTPPTPRAKYFYIVRED